MRLLLALPSLLLLAGANPDQPAALSRAIATYGVTADGARLKTMLVSWKYERHKGEQTETGQLFEQLSFPEMARREYRRERRGGLAQVSGTDGKRAWRVLPGVGVDPVRPSDFSVPLRVRGPAWLLAEVVAGRARAEAVPGAPADQQRLLLTRDNGEMLTLDVDEKTGLIQRYEGMAGGLTSTDRLTVTLDGWRKRGGVWFPERLTTHRNDVLEEQLTLEALRINGNVMEDLFFGPFGRTEPPSRKL